MIKKVSVRDMIYASMLAALTGILGYVIIPLPFSPVPITGQTLAIMLIGLVLSPFMSFMSVAIFLLLGIIGIPVFSGGQAGIGVLIGPKGGYLIGFLIGAVVISLIRKNSNNFIRMAISSLIGGVLIVYLMGVPWLAYITGMNIKKALLVGALPFIPGDLLKMVVALFIARKINNLLQKEVAR